MSRLLSRVPVPGALSTSAGVSGACSWLLLCLAAPISGAVAVRGAAYTPQALALPSINVYVAERFSERMRGRVYSAVQGGSIILRPLGMLLGAFLLTRADARDVLWVSAAVTAILAALPLLRRTYWSYRP